MNYENMDEVFQEQQSRLNKMDYSRAKSKLTEMENEIQTV